MTVEYRVIYESNETEQITVTAGTLTACLRAALTAATQRFDPRTGKRDHVVSIEFWERRA